MRFHKKLSLNNSGLCALLSVLLIATPALADDTVLQTAQQPPAAPQQPAAQPPAGAPAAQPPAGEG